MIKPKVSIIIPTYRRKDELKRALHSIKKQDYKKYEIILIDDNDDIDWNRSVRKIVSTFEEEYRGILIKHIENHPNLGSARARNVGIEMAEGEYICFLDDDDEYLEKRITNQLNTMILTEADYSLTDLALYSENNKLIEIRRRNYIKSTEPHDLFKYHLMYHMTGTDAMMFKAAYLKRIGGFDHIDVGDEFYLMLKAIENKGKFIYVPVCDVKAYVHTGDDNLSSGQGKIYGENLLYEYKKKGFEQLDKQTIKYINMRHHMVLAYAYLRMKRYGKTIKEGLKALAYDFKGACTLVLKRK